MSSEKLKKKPAVVMIGRFNPPTAGHYFVMDAMKKYIRENKLNVASAVIVIIDGEKTGKDKAKNPLSAHEREMFIKASGKANGIHILTAPNAFDAFTLCRKRGFEPIAIAAGSDRADHYVELLDTYFKKDESGKTIQHEKVPGLTRKSTDPNDLKTDIKAISGSMARAAALHGFEEEFIKIVGLEDKPELARKLFKKVVDGMSDDHDKETK